ncbi:transcriptional regulator [Sphaerisporangium krabiense]|uniref:Transcriptional regulator with XRE-family HTH domain n=1 Tax=Sphaerisporangium krabiense TaxID=763782 RepID=A0A7W8ZB43_9ACTN|nr:helix-turn-helix transcriptional regulator [Sphaerisporangium krabiense]MBB5630686.1 transcriptional regulator with XRE-family HTH domain [Sphaerisporangium krabiense]GII67447.1 transcriptional regulator [Sphaerisporangium krabiense]
MTRDVGTTRRTAREPAAGRPDEPEASRPGGGGDVRPRPGGSRRSELAAFLRSRRARLSPADVGLPPGLRRRTPGLRREEVAQLAGVGVTWYTWLEQGRRINASVQVLDAVARTLRLDTAEREHLYRLADVPEVRPLPGCDALEPEIHEILANLDPLPAAVYNTRYDLLAWNVPYAALFPGLVRGEPPGRNAIWQCFTCPTCCNPFVDAVDERALMVATLRAGFVRHLGEPSWEDFVRRLSKESPTFAAMWADHEVARPGTRMKIFQHSVVGTVRARSTSMALATPPETRMVVYTPMDEESRARITWLMDHPEARPDHTH